MIPLLVVACGIMGVVVLAVAALAAGYLWQSLRKLPEPDAMRFVDRFGIEYGHMSRDEMQRVMYRRRAS